MKSSYVQSRFSIFHLTERILTTVRFLIIVVDIVDFSFCEGIFYSFKIHCIKGRNLWRDKNVNICQKICRLINVNMNWKLKSIWTFRCCVVYMKMWNENNNNKKMKRKRDEEKNFHINELSILLINLICISIILKLSFSLTHCYCTKKKHHFSFFFLKKSWETCLKTIAIEKRFGKCFKHELIFLFFYTFHTCFYSALYFILFAVHIQLNLKLI